MIRKLGERRVLHVELVGKCYHTVGVKQPERFQRGADTSIDFVSNSVGDRSSRKGESLSDRRKVMLGRTNC